jgi:5-methylcytosine-specific restriction endonuclease McrA
MQSIPQLSLDFDTPVTKHCGRCKIEQSLSCFNRCKQAKTGYSSYCKNCNSAICRERNERNPEIKRQKAREYHAAHKHEPEFKAKMQARTSAWGNLHRQERCRSAQEWRQRNPEKVSALNKAWALKNPEKVRENVRRRFIRKHQYKYSKVSVSLLQAKISYWSARCWMCRAPYQAINHVKPLSKGGYHILCNLRPICRTCNLRKHNKWPIPQIPLRAK